MNKYQAIGMSAMLSGGAVEIEQAEEAIKIRLKKVAALLFPRKHGRMVGFSKLLGMKRGALAAILSGRNRVPMYLVLRLAMNVSVSLDWLLLGEGESRLVDADGVPVSLD